MLSRRRLLSAVLFLPLLVGAAATRANAQAAAHTTTLLPDTRVIILGGVDSAGTVLSSMTVHDARTGLWWSYPDMAVRRASHTATVLPDGRVLVAGGHNGTVPIADARIYDPQLNLWSLPLGAPNTLITARHSHTATLLPNGKVLIVGGDDGAGGTITNCELFDPVAENFSAADQLLGPRAAHTAVKTNNGLVFVAGGYRLAPFSYMETTELFDPDFGAAGTWMPGPALISKRAHHTATAMSDGRIMIMGGYNGRDVKGTWGYLDTTEIYNPIDDTITAGEKLDERKAFHTAVLMEDGQIVTHGGLGNVTTNYYTGSFTFEPGSTVTAVQSGVTIGSLNGTPGSLKFLLSTQLDVPTAGPIEEGWLFISSGRVVLDDARVEFAEPLIVSLQGVGISRQRSGGYIDDEMVYIDNPQGLIRFSPQTVAGSDGTAGAGSSIDFTPDPLPGGVSTGVVTGGTLNFNISAQLPDSNKGGTILIGSATIVSANITKESNVTQQGFTIDLTSGIGNIPGGTLVDANGNFTAAVSFTGLYGSIANTTTTAITGSPLDVEVIGQLIQGVTLKLEYVVSPKLMGGETFDLDVATIAIRRMLFASSQAYDPKKDDWFFRFEGRSIERKGHSSILHANGDVAHYGGWRCSERCFTRLVNPSSGTAGWAIVPAIEEDATTSWESITNELDEGRVNHTMTVLPDGRVLLAGGSDGPNSFSSCYLFDPETDEWSKTGDMKVPRSRHTATLLPNGTILVAGGWTTGESTGPTNTAEIFYPDVQQWIYTSPMISSRTLHTAITLPNGGVLVAGGDTNDGYLSAAEVYISTSRTWMPVGAMSDPRSQHSMNMLKNGQVLVAGGINANGTLDSAETYSGGAWTAVSAMNERHHSHVGMSLLGGAVLVAGGNDGFSETKVSEIYYPPSDTWYWGVEMYREKEDAAAVLAPNGNVLLSGGYASVEDQDFIVMDTQVFETCVSSFIFQDVSKEERAQSVSALLLDGRVLMSGGWGRRDDGTAMFHKTSEFRYFSPTNPDRLPLGESPRQPYIVSTDTRSFDRGGNFTVFGDKFKDQTEAVSGGTAGQGAHIAEPLVRLQRLDSGGVGSQASPSYFVDLTTRVFSLTANPDWEKAASSISVVVPTIEGELPYGWYHLRVGANAVYSSGYVVQAAPPRPTGAGSVPVGTILGVSSVAWNWTTSGVSGANGFNVYSATNGVWLATVTVSAGVWYQTGLGPDTSCLIKIAPYNLAGDGQVTVATIPVNTLSSLISLSTGVAKSTGSILWRWNENSSALYYELFSASAGVAGGRISSPTANQYLHFNLSTNTEIGMVVRAQTAAGAGELTPPVTVYTLAAAPLPDPNPFQNVSSESWTAHWLPNGNPATTTTYRLRWWTQFSTGGPIGGGLDAIEDIQRGVTGLQANTRYFAEVVAVNGDNKFGPDPSATQWTALGSTVTSARAPTDATITYSDLSTIGLMWSDNGNSTVTLYQVVLSTEDEFFSTIYSTPIAFSDNFTSTSTLLTMLLTGNTFWIRISAQDQYGHETLYVSTKGHTGGEPDKLAIAVKRDEYVQDGGYLNNDFDRYVMVRMYPNTFEQDVVLYISTQGVMRCGGIDGTDSYGISIQVVPAVQPVKPFEIGIASSGLTSPGSLGTIGLVRRDPAGGRCTNLSSRVEGGLVVAKTNHLSDFYIKQISPRGTIEDGIVYPNPLYTRNQSYFTFDLLPADARVRVYTLHGEILFEGRTDSKGMLLWDARNKVERPVASGVYLAVVEKDGDKEIMKLAVLR